MSQRLKSAKCRRCDVAIYPVCPSTARHYTGLCKQCWYLSETPFRGDKKRCASCHKYKPLSDYRRKSDGRKYARCKPCQLIYEGDYRSANRKRMRAHQAKWGKSHAKDIARKKANRYKTDSEYRKKVLARGKLYLAVKTGRIRREPCEKCGSGNAHGHHEDHSRPLDVRWLCQRCHLREHGCAV